MASQINPFDFLRLPAAQVAPRLLGCILERSIGNTVLRARIIETEAYDQTDAASHSYRPQTARTAVMFGNAGYLYVYFTYGMHYCCNVVTGPAGTGSAVLLRAVEPLAGEQIMTDNRGGQHGIALTNGPAKLCQALQIDKALNGHFLGSEPLVLRPGKQALLEQIITTTRIGISKAKDKPWRFYIAGNPYVSKV